MLALSITLIRNEGITKYQTWSSNLKRNVSQAFGIMVKSVSYLAILTITCLCLKSVTSFGSPFNLKFRFNEIKWLKRHIELEKQKTAIIASVSTKNFEDTITLGLLRMLKAIKSKRPIKNNSQEAYVRINWKSIITLIWQCQNTNKNNCKNWTFLPKCKGCKAEVSILGIQN